MVNLDPHSDKINGSSSHACVSIYTDLKGPKHEIFESGFFTQIGGLWLGELGTGEKN